MKGRREEIELTKYYLEDLNKDINAQIERTSMRLRNLEEIQKALLEEQQKLKETKVKCNDENGVNISENSSK
jgi:hypothetical protein